MKFHMFFFYCMIIAILVAIPHANAEVNLTYPQEYYELGNINDQMYTHERLTTAASWGMDSKDTFGIYMELRRQTILMEKQNELLEEQNKLLRSTHKLICISNWSSKYPAQEFSNYICDMIIINS